MTGDFPFCPNCRSIMKPGKFGYNYCTDASCGFVQYRNPTPVVAAIVEYGEGRIVLAHNVSWPAGWFGLITGFVEKNEHPDDTVLREVKEELGLEARIDRFIGHYTFDRMNQLIMAYHVRTEEKPILLDAELDEFKIIEFSKTHYWPAGTGYALRDFLQSKGYKPEIREFKKS